MTIIRNFDDGTSLYIKENQVGGETYYSDEIGCGVIVWDTSLVSEKTLRAALKHYDENKLEQPQQGGESE